MGKGSPDTGYRLPVGANDEPPKKPYRPTTREARMALPPEEEAKLLDMSRKVREMILLNEDLRE